jgi:hypothetical protein
MGDGFINSEKIWKVVYQEERKNEKQYSRLNICCGQDRNGGENREENVLEGLNKWNIVNVKKPETYSITQKY